MYLNEELTRNVIEDNIDIDKFCLGYPGVTPPQFIGAPGGSICVNRELFFEVGGYDPELFDSNSPEDIFFWNKIDEISKMEICDNPEIELFHMNHPATYNNNPNLQEMLMLHRSFQTATPAQKTEFINLKKETLKNFY